MINEIINIITKDEMNTETETKQKVIVKKDKVKKVRNLKDIHPLKGAFIDVDFDIELKDEPVDLFNKEYQDENKIDDNLDNELKEDYEDKLEQQRILKELDEEEERIRQKRTEILQRNLLRDNAKKYKTHMIDVLTADIKSNIDAIQKIQEQERILKEETALFQKQLAELEVINNDTKIMDYLAENFPDAVNEFIEDEKPKPVKAKKQKGCIIDDGKEKPVKKPKGEKKPNSLRKPNTKKEEWNNLPEGAEFKMIYNKSGLIYYKEQGKLVRKDTGEVFSGFHQAVTDYAYLDLGKKVSLKGWESFVRVV